MTVLSLFQPPGYYHLSEPRLGTVTLPAHLCDDLP